MFQPRRSAKLASQRARAAKQTLIPVPIPFDDDNTDNLGSLPAAGDLCFVCGFADGILDILSVMASVPDATPRSLRTMSLRSGRCAGQS